VQFFEETGVTLLKLARLLLQARPLFQTVASQTVVPTTTTTTTSLFHSLNIQVSHHLQIARLIEAGGVRTA